MCATLPCRWAPNSTPITPPILVSRQMRFLMLRNFNGRLQDVLPLIDLDRDKHNAYLATLVRKLRALVLLPVKRVVWKRVVRVTETEQRPHVRTDRALARRFRESGRMDTRGRYTVFGQLMRQLRNVAPAQLRNPSRAFHVSFIGEFADDYGGPYREALVEMCEELQSSALPLLVPCPNGRADHGLNREKWTVNPAATTPACMAMWEFLGLLVGIALRTGNPLDLDLPSLVWKRLSGEPVTIGDVAAIDMQAAVRLRDIAHGVGSAGGQSPSREAWTRMARDLQLRFTARGGDGREVELVPGGREIPVTWERRAEYVSLVQRFRTTEGQAQCEAMLRGVATQVPMHLLSLFTWHEVEYMACGSATIDVDFLRENTVRSHCRSCPPAPMCLTLAAVLGVRRSTGTDWTRASRWCARSGTCCTACPTRSGRCTCALCGAARGCRPPRRSCRASTASTGCRRRTRTGTIPPRTPASSPSTCPTTPRPRSCASACCTPSRTARRSTRTTRRRHARRRTPRGPGAERPTWRATRRRISCEGTRAFCVNMCNTTPHASL